MEDVRVRLGDREPSYATEWLKGRRRRGGDDQELGHRVAPQTPVKLHYGMLAEDAIHAAIADYKTKQEASAARVEQADQEMEREAAAGGR